MRIGQRLLLPVMGFVALAIAQIDGLALSAELRAKYGPALTRETFLIPAGEMVVDYGATGRVCRIGLPSVAPDDRQPGMKSAKAMDDFLLELIPSARRGKELMRSVTVMGAPGISVVAYENVTITEMLQGQSRTGVTVTFPNESCPHRPDH
ncbi:MAG: hypothetical protein ACR2JB_16275 [Bryobacteraceae bacterium]